MKCKVVNNLYVIKQIVGVKAKAGGLFENQAGKEGPTTSDKGKVKTGKRQRKTQLIN